MKLLFENWREFLMVETADWVSSLEHAYEILSAHGEKEVPEGDVAAAKKAFYAIATKYHPDRGGAKETLWKYHQAVEAWDVIDSAVKGNPKPSKWFAPKSFGSSATTSSGSRPTKEDAWKAAGASGGEMKKSIQNIINLAQQSIDEKRSIRREGVMDHRTNDVVIPGADYINLKRLLSDSNWQRIREEYFGAEGFLQAFSQILGDIPFSAFEKTTDWYGSDSTKPVEKELKKLESFIIVLQRGLPQNETPI